MLSRYQKNETRRQYQAEYNKKKREIIRNDPEKLKKHQEYMKDYVNRNRDSLNEAERRRYNETKYRRRLKTLGIQESEDLLNYIENHHGECDICGNPGDGRWKTLNIDHDHSTNKFRGMLCFSCNRALGYFKDNPHILQQAIEYLKKEK